MGFKKSDFSILFGFATVNITKVTLKLPRMLCSETNEADIFHFLDSVVPIPFGISNFGAEGMIDLDRGRCSEWLVCVCVCTGHQHIVQRICNIDSGWPNRKKTNTGRSVERQNIFICINMSFKYTF